MSTGNLSPQRLERMRQVMQGHVDRGELPGLVTLVSRRGETHVLALGTMAIANSAPMQRDTLFRIASMTKPIMAAAAMILVEECRLRLDDPVDDLLPELANRRVLRSIEAAIDDTVAAKRPITLRDLLTFRLGIGAIMAPPDRYPIQAAMAEAGLNPSPFPTQLSPDEWMKRLGGIPLVHQPGEGWLYHTGSDVLGVLVARASGHELPDFLRARIFDPLGMNDTGFFVPPEKISRLPAAYLPNCETAALTLVDDPARSAFLKPPAFPAGGGGLISTVDDYCAFSRMMLDKGRYRGGRILSRPAVELMTTDQLTPEHRASAPLFFGNNRGWGFGVAVYAHRDDLSSVPGRFGWDGGFGTSAYCDPQEDLIGILMTQRMMTSPQPPAVARDFWTSAYQAIDD